MDWAAFIRTVPSPKNIQKYVLRNFAHDGLNMKQVIVGNMTQTNTEFDQYKVMKEMVHFEHWSELHAKAQAAKYSCKKACIT